MLKKVIVHRPDMGISRISPKDAEELLFDDIVFLPQMQKEHDIFTDVLKAFIADLLEESLTADEIKKAELIRMIVDYEELPASFGNIFHRLDNKKLAEVLITGYYEEEDHYFFDPIPNFIFTRDIAVVVKDHDTMMFENEFLLIGHSERTTEHAIKSLAKVVLEKGLVKHVVQVNIPYDRSCMHIDTVFTRINHDHVVAFKPMIYDGISSNVEMFSHDGSKKTYPSLKDFILAEINPNMKFTFSGGGESTKSVNNGQMDAIW